MKKPTLPSLRSCLIWNHPGKFGEALLAHLLLWLFILSPAAFAQTTVLSDNFDTSQGSTFSTTGVIGTSPWTITRAGADWGARINGGILELTNDASATGNVNGWVFVSTPTTSFTAPYNTTLASNPGLVTWELNLRQIRTDPAGLASGSYGVAFVLAGSSTTAATAGQGYALVIGQGGSTDPLRLVTYSSGLQATLTNVITATTPLGDIGNEYLSIRVTFDPATSEWKLFGRSDGASAFTDPSSGAALTEVGTATNSLYTGSALDYLGAYWNGSTAANQTAFFDNVKVTVTQPSSGNTLYWDANGVVAGAGGAAPVGTWGTDTFWGTAADGTAATAAWTAGGDAVFSAGTDATGVFSVTVSGTQSVGSLKFEEGTVTLSGGSVEMSDATPVINVSSTLAEIQSDLTGAQGITKSGFGTLVLTGTKTFTGNVGINTGVLSIGADGSLGATDNDLVVNGTLKTTSSLDLAAGRSISGTSTFAPAAGTTLGVLGTVATGGLTLADAGTLSIQSVSPVLGALAFTAPGTISSTSAVSATSVSASGLSSGTAILNAVLDLTAAGTGNLTLNVGAGGTLRLVGAITKPGSGSNGRLSKQGGGTLRLEGVNTGLFGMRLGEAGASPIAGGVIEITNKDALGTADTDGVAGAPVVYSQVQLNSGTLTATTDLTGANALPNGASFAGRSNAPVILSGSAIEFTSDSSLFAAASTSGDITLTVNNNTTVSGALTLGGSGTITGFATGGTGKMTFSGSLAAFTTALKLKDSITVEINTPAVGTATSLAAVTLLPVHTLDAGTTLAVGKVGTVTTVTSYSGLNGASNSVLHFDVGGTAPGASDKLVFAKSNNGTVDLVGNVTFAGKVDVDFVNGFVPTLGQSFDLLDWDSGATVNFAGVDFSLLPDLTGLGLTWNTSAFFTSGVLTVVSSSINITDQPDPASVNPGASVTFTVVANGPGALTYQWYRGTTLLDGATNASFTIASVQESDQGNYIVRIFYNGDSVDSNPAFLDVIDPFVPVSIVTPPVPVTVNASTDVSFSVVAAGSGPISYQWYKDDEAIPGATNATLNLPFVQTGAAGSYKVIVTGPTPPGGGTNFQTAGPVTLTVNPPGAFPVTGNGTFTQNFDGMGTAASPAGYPAGWTAVKVAGSSALAIGGTVTTSTAPAFTTDNGSSTSGNIFNYGTTGNSDRALGSLGSGAFTGAFGASFLNSSALIVEGANLQLGFRAEQWRQNTSQANEVWVFEWKLGGNFNDTTGWTGAPAFNINEILTSAANGAAVNGNTSGNFATIPLTTLTGLSGWQPGMVLHIRWRDTDDTGGDAGMAIDDFQMQISGALPPAPAIFWDANGTVAGAGGPQPTGVWGTDAFWTATADGTGATTAWTPGADAYFSAGADATGAFTVSLSGTQDTSGVYFEDGEVTLTAGTLNFSDLSPVVNVSAPFATIGSVISGSNGLLKQGEGRLVLSGANLFTGTINISAGTLEVGADSALGAVANALILNGTLATKQTLQLPATRAISGGGGFAPEPGTVLTVSGAVSMTALKLSAGGTLLLEAPTSTVGAITLLSSGVIQGGTLTAGDITASYVAGVASIDNPLNFGNFNRNVTVADAGSTLNLSAALTLGGGGNNRLIKLGAGTLVLNGVNTGLNKVSLGLQSATPTFGGTIKFDNKDALGISQLFFNYGTLEATVPLVGANAIPLGLSLSGRTGTPAVLDGEDMEFTGANDLFLNTGTTGDIVLVVNNLTTFTGALNGATVQGISGFSVGGTGTLRLEGDLANFTTALHLRDTVTVEINRAVMSKDAAPAAELIILDSGTTLAVGKVGASTNVTAFNGLAGADGSELHFDIGGINRGEPVDGYDALFFVKPASAAAPVLSFAGSVKVSFLPGFTPAAGQSFDLMEWDAATVPDFTGVDFDLPDISGLNLSWDTDDFTTDGTISIINTNPITSVTIARTPATNPMYAGDNVEFTVTNITGAAPGAVTYQWLLNGEGIQGATSATLTLNNITELQSGSYSCRVTATGLLVGTVSNSIALTILSSSPVIVVEPQPALVFTGQPIALSVAATGRPPLKYQWKKNGANVPGATNSLYQVPAAAAIHAGTYTCEVTNASPTKATSAAVAVGVVENKPATLVSAAGATATFKAVASGPGLTFTWAKQSGALPQEARITLSADKKTLTIKSLQGPDSDTYFCTVELPGVGTLQSGTTTLKVFTNAPEIIDPVVMPPGIIGGLYDFTIPVNPDPTRAPTAYTATGLPAGLKLDAKTGRITGRPTKSGNFTVKIGASNARGKDSTDPGANPVLVVAAFPTNLAGVYAGPVERNSVLGGNLGGRFDLTVTGTGTFTGSLTLGTTRLALPAGALEISVSGTPLPYATVQIKRTGNPLPPPLTVSFSIDPATNRLVDGSATIGDGTNTVAFAAWRNIWSKALPATAYLDGYTFGLALDDNDPLVGDTSVPQGSGFGSFKVAADGKLTLAGKTPDGENLTGGSFVGPLGEVLVFQTMYTTKDKGSLLGHLTLDKGAQPDSSTDNNITGTLTLRRPPNPAVASPAAATRTYRDGFGPLELVAMGGRYLPPVGTKVALNLDAGQGNARLTFTEGGIDPNFTPATPDETAYFDYLLNIGAKSAVTYPAPNTRKVKLSPLTATTGAFGGSFELNDVAAPTAPASVKRGPITFSGMIIKDSTVPNGYIGVGYFMLPQFPTPTTLPIRSGHVLLAPVVTQ